MGAFECVTANKIIPAESTEVFTIRMSSTDTINERRKDVESQSSKPSEWPRSRSLWWTLGVDLPLVLIVAALIGLFELGIIPSHKAGFFCGDPALSYPYTGETIGSAVLMSTVLLLPIIISLPTEYLFSDADFSACAKLRQAIRNTGYLYRSYVFGFVMNLGVVEVIKGITGRPRPTFFDLCQPDTGKTCNGSEFVSSFQCTATQYSSWYQMDAYRSFPSGHSSLSVYCALFIAWYLQRRAFDWRHRTVSVVPLLQLAAISYAAICSLTRITDHRHHWWDVLVGAGIGLAAACYSVIALTDNFSTITSNRTSNLKSEESRQTVRTFLYDNQRDPITP